MAEAASLLRRLLSLSEERFGVALGEMLSSERFIHSVEKAVTSGATARNGIEKGLARMLQLFNVPTLEDVAQLEAKLEELESLIAELSTEVKLVEGLLRSKPKPTRRPRATTPTTAADEDNAP
ncbi:MAG: hypothetical protein ABIJ09_00595 [Pseudomonadota bacterium]